MFGRSLLVAVASLSLACVAQSTEAPKVGVDEDAEGFAAESVSGAVAVGTEFKTTADLNLRASASTSATILDVASKGSLVTAVSSYANNGFYQVSFAGQTGWMYGAYLTVYSTPSSGSASSGGSTSSNWSCSGSYGTTKMADGSYDLTEFGCWVDSSGVAHGDPGDNCIPGCLAKAKSIGLCASGDSGRACEERVNWYVADAGRFGCGTRVKITNPSNGRSVVAAVLDYGPACWVEAKVSHAALDASGRVNRYLFGADQGITDRAKVIVTEASGSTPLGPTN
jgi:uncharacterized protein YraI